MVAKLVLGVFCVLGAAWTAVWVWVLVRSRQKVSYSDVYPRLSLLRRRSFYVILAVAIVLFLFSVTWLPYQAIRARTVGPPQVVVEVTGRQWYWTFSRQEIPAGIPIVFKVTSLDVNHGFGLFDPKGELVAQVQAMPGYTNSLIYIFDEPGTYRVRCLELCGLYHHVMEATLTVK